MSNIQDEVTERRRALFDLVKSVGTLSVEQALQASGYTLGMAASYLADMHTANLLTRVRKGSGYVYSTDVAEFRWGERERELVAADTLQSTMKARARKASLAAPAPVRAQPEPAPVPVLKPVPTPSPLTQALTQASAQSPSHYSGLDLHPRIDVVRQLVSKIQDLPYRDVMRLRSELKELFA